MDTKKKCTTCGELLKTSAFYKVSSKPDKYQSSCKKCVIKWAKKYHQDNRAIIKQKRAIYYKANKKHLSNTAREYRKTHKKEIKAKQAENYLKNKKKYAAQSKKRRENIPQRLYDQAKRRAKKKGISFNIKIKDISVPKVCPALGIKIILGDGKVWGHSPSLDRINSSLGYEIGNIVVVSHKANTMKQDATIEEMKKLFLFYLNLGEKKREIQGA